MLSHIMINKTTKLLNKINNNDLKSDKAYN